VSGELMILVSRWRVLCSGRVWRWVVRMGVLVVVVRGITLVGVAEEGAEEMGTEAKDQAFTVTDPGWVLEEELAPTLESNRQPLGPDPLELPQWRAEEVAAFEAGRPVNLGGGLWSPERFPLQAVPPWPPLSGPLPAPAPGVVGWELLSRFAESGDWCVDPQRVLLAADRSMVETHLAAHARAAYHPVRLWVFAGGQKLAEGLEDATLHQAAFGPDRPGVLVVCAVDDPMAARVVVPPVLAVRAAPWWAGVVRRVAPRAVAPPGAQLSQMVLWLTLEAEALPGIRDGEGTAGWQVAAEPSGVYSVAWYRRVGWPAVLVLVAVAVVAVWRLRGRRPLADQGRGAGERHDPDAENTGSP
jgi:hypothetical protein